jgi:hypothetical protein
VVFVMKAGKVYCNRLGAPAPDPQSLLGSWIALGGPNVPARLEFKDKTTVQITAAPGEAPTTAGYQLKAPNTFVISAPAGGQKTYRWHIDSQLLTLDEENGPRFILRRMP